MENDIDKDFSYIADVSDYETQLYLHDEYMIIMDEKQYEKELAMMLYYNEVEHDN